MSSASTPSRMAHDPRIVRAARLALVAGAVVAGSAACDREERAFRESPPSLNPVVAQRMARVAAGDVRMRSAANERYLENAFQIAEGQRLFTWFNCSGCHANGGGGMGPPLMDDEWRYGSAPEDIYQTIVEGRPNGMPSFAARIPSSQVWQLVAFVRALSGLTPSTARWSRTDHMMMQPGSQALRRPERPKPATMPSRVAPPGSTSAGPRAK